MTNKEVEKVEPLTTQNVIDWVQCQKKGDVNGMRKLEAKMNEGEKAKMRELITASENRMSPEKKIALTDYMRRCHDEGMRPREIRRAVKRKFNVTVV